MSQAQHLCRASTFAGQATPRVKRSSTCSGVCRYKLFNLSKAYNKGLSQSDVQLMATSVLLAALSILPYEHRDKDRTEADSELEKERSVRMATILGFSVDTKRNARSAAICHEHWSWLVSRCTQVHCQAGQALQVW